MVTLILITVLISASCAAAAGLIASAQNDVEVTPAVGDMVADPGELQT